ncbi:hypothetical protein [Paenibacillus sanguinis]|uniref:hypothetical protein n=1 Tax=Paenibacillus sanguinis TaxID=225906 RepID=UPI00037AE0B0|nr:hypothetical protein [Paenibacillus sanguinis]
MSQPGMPNITPVISVDVDQTIVMLLSSIAMEEMALAHLVNSGAEQVQYVLGTLENGLDLPAAPTVEQLMTLQRSMSSTMQGVILKEMMLLMKLGQVVEMDRERQERQQE